ncbi:hypothetical protein I79_007320 [Cricetulus griseus]|uniref:Uncharacterized protein n=1 Tax=Cricetulus griseus TaxID=10029 RepID=G3HA78_CRIGR|nr:hypothetical protein I79_007320 [Cricetulus griseus]
MGCVFNRNVNISNKKAQYKASLPCLTPETAHDKVGCSWGIQWSENTKDHQARVHKPKGSHFRFAHPV